MAVVQEPIPGDGMALAVLRRGIESRDKCTSVCHVSRMAPPDDPIEFNPLSVENIGVTLAVELLEQSVQPMPPEPFFGAGVYALYYQGDHEAYKELTILDHGRNKYPVYIGKAAGESSKQGFRVSNSTKNKKLFSRISEHSKSIESVNNLSLSDFSCRYLVLNDAYIGLAESVLIRIFRPPWNGMSFGSKVVGKYRMSGDVGLWDALHPGRAGRPAGTERADKAEELISNRLKELQAEIKDREIKRIYDRIMRFV